jgi:hypothetical protein
MKVAKRKYKIKLMAKRKVQIFKWPKEKCKFFMAKREFFKKESIVVFFSCSQLFFYCHTEYVLAAGQKFLRITICGTEDYL